jgi:hypothetical protein
MGEPQLPREVRRRLAMIKHAEEVTGNVAMTCRYYGISRTRLASGNRTLERTRAATCRRRVPGQIACFGHVRRHPPGSGWGG